jgi:hypothetical protein
MKTNSILVLVLFIISAISLFAALPVVEYFSSPTLDNTWDQFWPLSATLESVPAGTDGIADPPGGNGYIGRSTAPNTGASSSGHVTGDLTDANYSVEAWVWIPVVNTADVPDDFWYQQLVFYQSVAQTAPYGRLHAQFNLNTTAIAAPRIRCQTSDGSTFYTFPTSGWVHPTDFTYSEGWHKLKIAITGQTAVCYYDDAQLAGTADWSSTHPGITAGRFGFGQYVDGAGTHMLYVDNFKAWATAGTEPPDQPTPTPAATPSPTPAGFAGAENWTWYE